MIIFQCRETGARNDERTVQHDESSEGRQKPDPSEEWWQDSVFVTWHAAGAGIGGLFRIGHEPHYEGGVAALWFGSRPRTACATGATARPR